jgi:hypothetical protein
MSTRRTVKKAKRPVGRPKGTGKPVVHDRIFQMRVASDFLEVIDEWRQKQPETLSRSDAIRHLVEAGLEYLKAQGR